MYSPAPEGSNYKHIFGECILAIVDTDKLKRCIHKRRELADLKEVMSTEILAYVFAVRIDPEIRDEIIQMAKDNDIELRTSEETTGVAKL